MPIQRDRETSSNQNETIIFTCWRFIRDDFAHFVFHHTRGQLSFQHRPPRPVRCWLRYSRAACRIRTTSSLFLSNPQEPPVPCESIESSMNLRFCTEESTHRFGRKEAIILCMIFSNAWGQDESGCRESNFGITGRIWFSKNAMVDNEPLALFTTFRRRFFLMPSFFRDLLLSV
jgi:hypothetical protein